MDAICSLLQGPRARGAFLIRSSMNPPWSMRVQDEAPLTIAAIVRGDAWVIGDDDEPVELRQGDVALLRGPKPYIVADDPATPPQVIIDPGQICRMVDGSELFGHLTHSIRSWGNHVDGRTLLVTGAYETAGEVSERLLRALPAITVIRHDEWETPLVGLLADEIVKDAPGQPALLDRLLDLLCLAAVRACFTRPGAQPPTWYRASADPIIGPALELIHNNPAEPWTVASLATHVGASRAAFARRFNDLMGEPPLTYLTNWRLDLAADQLGAAGATANRVARAVGYASPFAFSHAFKRRTGTSPTEYRLRRKARTPASSAG
jgi:AraC-like DNA-binding protein